MNVAVLRRRMLRHGFILLFLAFLLGFPTAAGGPNGRQWMGAHITSMLGATFVLILAFAAGDLRLSDRQRFVLFISSVHATYVGWALGVFAAVTGTPGPVTGTTDLPDGGTGVILVPGLIILIVSAFTFTGLAIYGLRGDSSDAKTP
jgi:hypothetical protein